MRQVAVGSVVAVCVASLALLLAPVSSWPAMNRANPGLPKVDNVFSGQPSGGIANNGLSAMCVSCHPVAPAAGRTTHFVSHYSQADSANRTTTAARQADSERLVVWNGSGALSKYGNLTSWGSDNGVEGQLICESCHNMVRNVGGGNNLVESCTPWDSRPAQPNTLTSTSTTLCEGCHVTAALPGHHPMTGDVLSDGTTLSTAATPFTRGYVDNTSDVGPAGMTVPPGSEVRYARPDGVSCLSCHGNGHTGYTGSGARLLRRGYAAPGTPTPPGPGAAVGGADTTGIDRQVDHDPTGTNRLIGNFTPLCDACHKSDD